MANYVLVHGGWHGAWCWDKVVPLLQAAGHKAYAPTLTGLGEKAALLTPEVGLDTHIQDVVDLIKSKNLQHVILVGHSYSGMVITGVADHVPDRISQLVYLDAATPRDGQSLTSMLPLMETILRRDADKNGDGWRVNPPKERLFRKGLFDVTKEPDLSLVRSKITPQSLKTFIEPLHITHPDALAAIPHTFIECTRRGALIWLIRRISLSAALPPVKAGWNRLKIASGHDAMIIAPQAVVDSLLKIA